MRRLLLVLAVLLAVVANISWAQETPHILSTSPTQNELNVPVNTNISVTFDKDMDEATINDSTFVVNARSTGLHEGTITYNNGTRTATLDPINDFDVGEVVTVVLTRDIQSSQGVPLDSSYSWSFTIRVNDGSGIFGSHSTYPVGDRPFSVFAADLDGDGDLDLATANWGSFALPDSTVSVLLNNGDGTFAPDSVYAVDPVPLGVFAADLDGDGDLDLTTTNGEPSCNVSVLLNNGDGTFAPHSSYEAGTGGHTLIAADLDDDGDLDLAVEQYIMGKVSVLLNNGDGTFAPYSDYPVGGYSYALFAADLNGDGYLDLAVGNVYFDSVSVLLNKGDGTFRPHSAYPVGDFVNSVFAADLDGDGDLDLVAGKSEVDSVSVLLNNGDGTFPLLSDYAVGDRPTSIFAADLDGDGDLDLVTANQTSSNVSVLLNQEPFIRGDVAPPGASDGSVTMADGLMILGYYYGETGLDCMDAGDVDDNGDVTMGDGLQALGYYYGDPGTAPEPPFPYCGIDPTLDDDLDCVSHTFCMDGRAAAPKPASVEGAFNKLVLQQAVVEDGIMRVPVLIWLSLKMCLAVLFWLIMMLLS